MAGWNASWEEPQLGTKAPYEWESCEDQSTENQLKSGQLPADSFDKVKTEGQEDTSDTGSWNRGEFTAWRNTPSTDQDCGTAYADEFIRPDPYRCNYDFGCKSHGAEHEVSTGKWDDPYEGNWDNMEPIKRNCPFRYDLNCNCWGPHRQDCKSNLNFWGDFAKKHGNNIKLDDLGDPEQANTHKPNHRVTKKEAILQKSINQQDDVLVPYKLFKKLLLSKQPVVEVRPCQTFGNTSPIGFIGMLIALTPFASNLMGLHGAAPVGPCFFTGGLITIISGILELLVGNTANAAVFTSFGAFFLSWAATLIVSINNHASNTILTALEQMSHPTVSNLAEFNSMMGFFFLFIDIFCMIYFICAVKTNLVVMFSYLSMTIGFGLVVGSCFRKSYAFDQRELSALEMASKLDTAAAAMLFSGCLAILYGIVSSMLQVLKFTVHLPMGELSTKITISLPVVCEKSNKEEPKPSVLAADRETPKDDQSGMHEKKQPGGRSCFSDGDMSLPRRRFPTSGGESIQGEADDWGLRRQPAPWGFATQEYDTAGW